MPPDVRRLWVSDQRQQRRAYLAAVSFGLPERLGLKKIVASVRNRRKIGKKDMLLNSVTPRTDVDPETYEVHVDGMLNGCEPARALPLVQRYFLY